MINLTNAISALDQKEQELLAEVEKVRTARVMIKAIFNDSPDGSVKQVTVTKNPSRAGININLPAAKSRVLPYVKSKSGITFKSLLKHCTQVNGLPYAVTSMKAYISALSAAGLIEKRKDRFFKVS